VGASYFTSIALFVSLVAATVARNAEMPKATSIMIMVERTSYFSEVWRIMTAMYI